MSRQLQELEAEEEKIRHQTGLEDGFDAYHQLRYVTSYGKEYKEKRRKKKHGKDNFRQSTMIGEYGTALARNSSDLRGVF